MRKRNVRYFLIGMLVALVLIQFFPIDQHNPEVNMATDLVRLTNPDDKVADLLKGACYDCHSNTTKYPWYARIQPVGWWMKGHFKEGRKHVNFSTWGTYEPKKKAHKIEECIEVMEEGRMPLKSYTWTHEDARLSKEENVLIADWFKSLQ